MKLLIASDIHGAANCAEKLINRIVIEKPDKVLLLGDILYHGPRNVVPNDYDTVKTAELINKKSDIIVAVRGNCDAEVDEMMLDFNIGLYDMFFNIDGLNIFATHGHHYNTSHLPSLMSVDVLLHGHTHIPTCELIGKNKYYINPGSTSIPKGDSTNSYLIFENRIWTWKTLNGEIFDEFKM